MAACSGTTRRSRTRSRRRRVPPSAARTRLSASSRRTIRPRPAPIARRTAISRVRLRARERSRPATLVQATRSTASARIAKTTPNFQLSSSTVRDLELRVDGRAAVRARRPGIRPETACARTASSLRASATRAPGFKRARTVSSRSSRSSKKLFWRLVEKTRRHRERHVEVGVRERSHPRKRLRRHAEDRESPPVQDDGASHDGGIAGEFTPPESGPEHDDGVAAGYLVFVVAESPADARLDAERAEVVARHEQAAAHARRRSRLGGEADRLHVQVRDDPVVAPRAAAQVEIFAVGERLEARCRASCRRASRSGRDAAPGYGRKMSASTMLKVPAANPMPRAIVTTTKAVRPGARRRLRTA